MHFVKTHLVRAVGSLLIALFALSLVWCADAACRTEKGDDQCTSLICALLAKKGSGVQPQNGSLSTSCDCACHMPIVPAPASGSENCPIARDNQLESPISIPAPPLRLIDQPPRA